MIDYLDRDYTHKLLGCAYAVHSALGPGLLESIYEKAVILMALLSVCMWLMVLTIRDYDSIRMIIGS